MTEPRPAEIRHRVDPGDVPPEKAARRLHLTLERFTELLPKLQKRGFPDADPDTGNYDLDAIDMWRKSRNPRLFGLTTLPAPEKPQATPVQSLGDRFRGEGERATKERRRHGSAA